MDTARDRRFQTMVGVYAYELRMATLGWCKSVISGKEFDERYAQLKMVYGRSQPSPSQPEG